MPNALVFLEGEVSSDPLTELGVRATRVNQVILLDKLGLQRAKVVRIVPQESGRPHAFAQRIA